LAAVARSDQTLNTNKAVEVS